MYALMVDQHGGPEVLQYREVDEPEVGAGQIVVDVEAAGVNFPDLLITQGQYQVNPPLPFAPGSEVSGVVSAVGEGVSSRRVGERVIGLGFWGGYAEKAVLGEAQVAPLPEEVPFEVGAALTTTYGTMLHALEDRARLKKGETVLVLEALSPLVSKTYPLSQGAEALRAIAAREVRGKVVLLPGQ